MEAHATAHCIIVMDTGNFGLCTCELVATLPASKPNKYTVYNVPVNGSTMCHVCICSIRTSFTFGSASSALMIEIKAHIERQQTAAC